MNRLDTLIPYHLDEDPQYSNIQMPDDLQGRRDIDKGIYQRILFPDFVTPILSLIKTI